MASKFSRKAGGHKLLTVRQGGCNRACNLKPSPALLERSGSTNGGRDQRANRRERYRDDGESDQNFDQREASSGVLSCG